MSLAGDAEHFFARLVSTPEAVTGLEGYSLVVHLVAPDQRVIVDVRSHRCERHEPGRATIGLWDLELEGSEDALRSVLVGEATLGEAIYRGCVFVPEEKSKHNLVCALGQAIRLTQERMPRAPLADNDRVSDGVG